MAAARQARNPKLLPQSNGTPYSGEARKEDKCDNINYANTEVDKRLYPQRVKESCFKTN